MKNIKEVILEEYSNNNLVSLFSGKNDYPIKTNKYSPSFDNVDYDLIVYHLNLIAEKDTNVQKEIDLVLEEMIKRDYENYYCAFSILWSIAYDAQTKVLKVNLKIKKLIKEYYQKYAKELAENYIDDNLSYKEQIDKLNDILYSKQTETLLC